jgi:hypothetical protein
LVTQGSIQVKLSPPKSSKYLYPINDYENFEFSSPVNPWEPQAKYKADFNKIKCLDITLYPGKILYIPAYWWFSFKFDENTSVSCFKYRTYMNNIAISPKIGLYILQNQNIERKIAKQINIQELQSESISNKINNENENNNKPQSQNEILDYKSVKEIEPLPSNNLIHETLINNEHLEGMI